MYAHLLVPTEGSPLSEKAVRAAAALARHFDARLTLLYVQPEHSYPVMFDMPAGIDLSPDAYRAAAADRAREVLERGVAIAAEEGVEPQRRTEEDDHPWRAICRSAESLACDLIVMASHGVSGLDALLLGSETRKVLTHSRVPVLVYR